MYRVYNYVLNIVHAGVWHDRLRAGKSGNHSREINIYFSGERFTPNHSDQWHEISEMFSPRSNFATVILDDMIFVIGGYNGISEKKNLARSLIILLIYYILERNFEGNLATYIYLSVIFFLL